MDIKPVFQPFASKPVAQYFKNPMGMQLAVVRDNFHISTWLLLGAMLQGALYLLPYQRLTLLMPALVLLIWRIARPFAIMLGLTRNVYMDEVIPGRTVPVYADKSGAYNAPADVGLCAIMLAVRSNHPLGMFAPGYKEVADYFVKMCEQMDADPAAHGYLGNSAWLSAADRGVSSEYMSMVYFQSAEALHAFAEGALHREAMEWWTSTLRQHPHIGIMHEVYAAPKKGWEGVYINYHPTGLNATFTPAIVKDGEDERKVWMSPMVLGKGQLRSSKGRMGRFARPEEKGALDDLLEKEEAI